MSIRAIDRNTLPVADPQAIVEQLDGLDAHFRIQAIDTLANVKDSLGPSWYVARQIAAAQKQIRLAQKFEKASHAMQEALAALPKSIY